MTRSSTAVHPADALEDSRARLAAIEQRVADGDAVSAGEFAEAEAAVRLAERQVEAAHAREAATAEAERLARVEQLRRQLVDLSGPVPEAARRVLDARRHAVEALSTLRELGDAYQGALNTVIVELAELAKAGPTPGLHAARGLSGRWQVSLGRGVPSLTADNGMWHELFNDVASQVGRAWDGRGPLDSPTRQRLELVAAGIDGQTPGGGA